MCKKQTNGYCHPPSYKDYEDEIKSDIAVVSDKTQPTSKKRKHSEAIGEAAAIQANADIHGLTFSQSKGMHIAFHGPHVPDLVFETPTGTPEVKEAKGGSSSYGDRKDHLNGGRAKQCTPEYMEVIIDLLKNSKYKGRHPDTACVPHTGNPIGTCKDCKEAEAERRRNIGEGLYLSYYLDELVKRSVRGDYEGDCPKKPKIIDDYKIVNGIAV